MQGHRAAVGGDDRGDQGEAEAVAALLAGPGTRDVAAGEALEGVVDEVVGEAGAVVVDGEATRVGGDGDGGAGGRVLAGVGQQVRHDLVQALLVAGDLHGLLGQREPPLVVGGQHPGVGDGLDEESGEVDGFADERAAGVEAGEEQQVLDQGGHPPGLLLDLGQRRVGRRPVVGAAAGELGVAGDRRQRRPQLVRGVRHELAHLLLAPVPGAQRCLDVLEHRVQRRADLADLGALVGEVLGHPLLERDRAGGQRELGHRVGGRRDLAQRPQLAAYDDRADAGRRQRGQQEEQRLGDEEGRDRVVHVGGRQSGDDDGVGVLRGEHAVVTGLADVDLVDLAVDRHGLQLLQRGVGERVALAGAVTEDLATGLVDAQHGEQRAGRLVAHVVIAGTRPQLTVDALRGLDHLLVQLVQQLVADGHAWSRRRSAARTPRPARRPSGPAAT